MILLPEPIFFGEWIGCCRSHILYICHWGLMAWSVDQGQTNPTTGEPRPANLELPTFKHINHTYSLQSGAFSPRKTLHSLSAKKINTSCTKGEMKSFFLFSLSKTKLVCIMCVTLNNMLPSWSLPCQEYEHYIPSIKAPGFRFGHFQRGLSL